jgi:von Willebrand factor type A domain
VTFISPLGALVALAVLGPLVAFLIGERNRERVIGILGIPGTGSASRWAIVTALVAIAALLGAAAAQPTLVNRSAREVRSDAAAFFVIDTSRSMLASSGPGAPTRFERAKAFALHLRNRLPDIRIGLATFTDRVLPTIFPTADRQAFDTAIRQSIAIERPPPSDGSNTLITTLSALTSIALDNYFEPEATKRLVVVLTDGESAPFFDGSIGALFRGPPPVHTIYVQFWRRGEHVYLPNGKPEPRYRTDPAAQRTIRRLADASDGVAIENEDVRAATETARTMLGNGPKTSDARERRRVELAPYLAFGVLAPLGFLLYRRNA